MTMDLTQASQMLKWLDEERRNDKTLIATLHERLESQAQQAIRQEEQLTALQESVAGLEVLLNRTTELAQGLEHLRIEVVNMLELRDEQRRKEQREMERTRQLEIGALRDEITRVADEIRHIPRLDERIAVVVTEGSRLNEALQRLEVTVADQGRRFDDRLQTVTYLEEQRRADHQRIVGLEKELPKLRKRIEATSAKLPFLEDATSKMKTRLEEGLKPIKEFEGIVEELRVADFRRNQEVKKWADQADEVRQEMKQLREERQRFLGDYRDVREAMKRLQTFQKRLEVRQNESIEMQRVLEERLRRQWEEWQGKQEKDRRNWEVTAEEQWREQTQINDRHNKQLEAVPPALKLHQSQLSILWEARRAEASRLLKVAQDEYEALVAGADRQLAVLREQSEPKRGV